MADSRGTNRDGRSSKPSGLPSRRSIHGSDVAASSNSRSGSTGSGSQPSSGGAKPVQRNSVLRNGSAAGATSGATRVANSAGAKPPRPASDSTKAAATNGKNSKKGKKDKKKRSLGARIGLGILFFLLALVILGSIGFIVAYASVTVPKPGEFALAQKTTVYYSDGESELGTFAEIDRTIIDTDELPEYVGHAVVASEDRTFYTNSGIDLKGIARALVNNIRGGALQGASTLSQQYVERYYLDTTTSIPGKVKEALLALKINRQQSKDEILENYMNTIYFGRGAYGIEEASRKYFGHPASELTLGESAMLAGIIPSPSSWDPAVDPDAAHTRFDRVLQFMVEDGWVTQAEADAAEFPETVDPSSNSSMVGWQGHVMQQIRQELNDRAGITPEMLDSGGYSIVSTIDKDLQVYAVQAVEVLPDDHATNLQVALTSINPENGEIYALYGGADYQERQVNAATQDHAMAGSTMKAFGLVAYMEAGGTLNDVYNGNSPVQITDKRTGEVAPPLQNYGNYSYGQVTMERATALSLNTAFVEMNNAMGPEKTREAAIKLGLPEDTPGLDDTMRNILGSASPRNIDIARAYATIAAGGVRTNPHIIREVTKSGDNQVYQGPTTSERVYDAQTISGMIPGLRAAAQYGSAEKAGTIGRPVIAKTGSSNDNRSAQFAGAIPQMTTVVSMYQVGEDGSEESITPFGGLPEITGSTWPGTVWQTYMSHAVERFEVADFDWVTKDNRKSTFHEFTTAPPTTEPPTEAPTEAPTQAPTEPPTEAPTAPPTQGEDNGDEGE